MQHDRLAKIIAIFTNASSTSEKASNPVSAHHHRGAIIALHTILASKSPSDAASIILPQLAPHFPRILEALLLSTQQADEFSFIALRIIAQIASLTNAAAGAGGSGSVMESFQRALVAHTDVVPMLLALVKTDDEMVVQHAAAALFALALGPHRFQLSDVLVSNSIDAVAVILRLCRIAHLRGAGLELLGNMLLTTLGARACHRSPQAPDLETIVAGTALGYEWKITGNL